MIIVDIHTHIAHVVLVPTYYLVVYDGDRATLQRYKWTRHFELITYLHVVKCPF